MSVALNHKTIGDLDNGLAGAMIDRALGLAISDLDDRGQEDGKPRVVTIKVALSMIDKMVVAQVECDLKQPPQKSGLTMTSQKHRKEGRMELMFEPANAEAPDQPTLPFGSEEDEQE